MRIEYIVVFLSCLDLYLTYMYLEKYQKVIPLSNYEDAESNIILRFAYKKLGFQKGSVIGSCIVLFFVTVLAYYLRTNLVYFMAGSLTMMIVIHFNHFTQLNILEKSRRGK